MVTPLFTNARIRRLAGGMLLIAAAAAVATAALPVDHGQPRRQATATVRILRAEPLNFAQIERRDPGALRTSRIRTRDGGLESARLIEFQ